MVDTKNRPPLTQSGIVGKTPKRIFIMCSFSNFAGSIISAGPAPVNRKRHLLSKRTASPTSVTELSVWGCLLTRFNRRLPPEPYSDSEKDTLWNRPIPEGSLLLVKRSKFYISTSEKKAVHSLHHQIPQKVPLQYPHFQSEAPLNSCVRRPKNRRFRTRQCFYRQLRNAVEAPRTQGQPPPSAATG